MRKSKEVPTDRLCRLDGQKPTARDRWQAFHRLYRLSHGHGSYHDMGAGNCFRVLFSNWSWFRLLDSDVPSVSRVHYPIFLRRRLLEQERRQRLYGNHPEWAERDKVVARRVRNEQGVEVTPDEVAVIRRKIIDIARQKAREKGFTLPSDDEDVLRLLKASGEKGGS